MFDFLAMTELDLNLFYVEDDPEISEQARAILTQYSGVPEDELVSHVRAVVKRLLLSAARGIDRADTNEERQSMASVQISMHRQIPISRLYGSQR